MASLREQIEALPGIGGKGLLVSRAAVLAIIDQHRCIPDRDAVLLFASAIAAQMPEEWVESESSMAMTVTVRCRDVATILAALKEQTDAKD